jgi:hypothetical protein
MPFPDRSAVLAFEQKEREHYERRAELRDRH